MGMTATVEQLQHERASREQARAEASFARDKRQSWRLGLFTSGRVFLGLTFAGSAGSMLADFGGTVASLQETLFDVHRLLPFALVFQLAAGLCVAAGFYARLAAASLAAYLLASLLVVPPDLSLDLGRAIALANLGLIGALAMLASHGAGRLSADHARERRRKRRLNAARRR